MRTDRLHPKLAAAAAALALWMGDLALRAFR